MTPEMLVSFASNVTAVRVPRISDPEDFRESCLRRKQCALVIFDGINTMVITVIMIQDDDDDINNPNSEP